MVRAQATAPARASASLQAAAAAADAFAAALAWKAHSSAPGFGEPGSTYPFARLGRSNPFFSHCFSTKFATQSGTLTHKDSQVSGPTAPFGFHLTSTSFSVIQNRMHRTFGTLSTDERRALSRSRAVSPGLGHEVSGSKSTSTSPSACASMGRRIRLTGSPWSKETLLSFAFPLWENSIR